MDKGTRNQIKNTVLEIRRLLELDVAEQLEGVYGIARTGKAQPPLTMPTLREDPVLRHCRGQIDAALKHDSNAGLSPKETVARFIHETAYTALNRLVAVKILEARSLLHREAVAEGRGSAGFKDFQKVCPQVCQVQPDGGYQLFLELLYDELAASTRPLFDRGGPHSTIFPRWTALDQVLSLLNAPELADVWAADETIGWVYQFFNTPDREKVHQGGRPQRSQDVAVINQFYTPRYIVEFLVDNTLGRLWLEMRRGETRLTETCQMLVRRPDKPLRRRASKDPREIKILDPAVGSGHFLHYAFDLFTIMYEESGYDPAVIPALILENNLFGIDIDPRAAQLAAFTLYLRARAYEQAHGAPARVRLPTANIVVAEPMPGDKRLFEEFIADQPQVVQSVCRRVWDLLALAAEAGSLLKVEVAFDEAIAGERVRLTKEPLFDTEEVLDDAAFWAELEGRIVSLFNDYYRRALAQADVGRALFAAEGEQGFRFLDLSRQDYDVVLMNPPYGDTTETAKRYLEDAYPDTKNDLYAAFIDRTLQLIRTEGYIGAITSRTFMFLTSFRKLRENTIFTQARMSPVADLGFGVLDTAMVETVAFALERPLHDGGPSVFFRLLKEDDREAALLRCIADLRAGRENDLTHTVRQETFALLSGTPMPYWVSDRVREAFGAYPSFAKALGSVQVGLSTQNDSRFVRLFWEVNPADIGQERQWVAFAKGGEYSQFYDDVHLLVNWAKGGAEINEYIVNRYSYLNSADWLTHPESDYFRFGLTYPRTTVKGFNVRILPSNCIFGNKGPGIFPPNESLVYYCLGLFNSRLVEQMLLMQTPSRSWEVGSVQNIIWIAPSKDVVAKVNRDARRCHHLKRDLDRINEISHAFTRPKLLRYDDKTLTDRFLAWLAYQDSCEVQIAENSFRIDQAVLDLYEISERDRQTIDREPGSHMGSYPRKDAWSEEDDEALRRLYLDDARDLEAIAHSLQIHPTSIAVRRQALGLYRPDDFAEAVVDLISYCIGSLFGRWDIRIGAGELDPPPLPDPEEGLLLYPPGALRPDSSALEPIGPLGQVIQHLARHTILVDDPGHKHDVVAAVEACLAYLFGEDDLLAPQAQAEEALGRDLRKWLARYFFPLHIKRYSKSRRKAPLYWQLITPSKGYSLWLYYHALGPDTLYTAIRQYAAPKIEFEEGRLKELQGKFAQTKESSPAREARRLEKAIEDQVAFLQELYAFRSELRRLADWGYAPDLNDGVLINIAPLHRLVAWKEAEKMWEKLEAGEYEWSTMAQHMKQHRQEGR